MEFLKSKLIRHEIKHWLLIVALSIWGLVATAYAFSKSQKVVLIGIDDSGARIITDSKDRILKVELQKFITTFLDLYYVFDEKTFQTRAGQAADFFTEDLWNEKKPELLKIHEKLQTTPLSQSIEIESIDLIEDGKVEVLLRLHIKSRMSAPQVKLKVLLEYRSNERSEANPWGFQITGITERMME